MVEQNAMQVAKQRLIPILVLLCFQPSKMERIKELECVKLSFLKRLDAFTKFFHFDKRDWFTFQRVNVVLAAFRMQDQIWKFHYIFQIILMNEFLQFSKKLR